MSNLTVGVIGLGNWGTALAQHLSVKGITVIGWSKDKEEVQSIQNSKMHPHFFPGKQLLFRAVDTLSEVLKSQTVIIAVPSAALDEVVSSMKNVDALQIVSAIKGFEKENLLTPLQYLEKKGCNPKNLCVLSGPSFASEVIEQKPCGIVAASVQESFAQIVAALFSSPSMRVYTSSDPLGVELGGALKNVIALAAGVSDGLGFGDSARAGLITRGLSEMVRLGVALGAKKETFFGLSGLGDLAMTASSTTSRNHTVGFRLGKGESLDHILRTLGSVSEGVATAPLVLDLAKRHSLEMPIAEAICELLRGGTTALAMAQRLMERPLRSEF